MCIQNLIKFCPLLLKIWSKNKILESIKGLYSVANLRKTMIYNTNIDLVNDDVYTKFCLILSIRSQDITKNQILTSRAVYLLQICKKTIIYITNVDLVNDNGYKKFGLILSIQNHRNDLIPPSPVCKDGSPAPLPS